MMKRNLGIAAALLAALVGLEHYGLERTPEKREEDKSTRLAELPASSVLPSYVASLFLGAFRVIIIDALWVETARMRNQEHRYFETVEIMTFISVLQPRNPEIWSVQAQTAGWDIANPTRDPARKWEWIKTAFRTLDRGIKQLPDNPYLKSEMNRLLMLKPTVQDGAFDGWLLQKVEEDDEIQALLQGTPSPTTRKTAFECADDFLERASNDMEKVKERDGYKYYTSQTGYNLSHSTLDGYRRLAMMFQAHLLWERGRPAEAALWFRKAADQADYVYGKHKVAIYRDYADIDRKSADLADLHAKGGDAVLPELVAKMDAILRAMRSHNDYGHLQKLAGVYKRRLGGDAWEWNDSAERSTDLRGNRTLEANLGGGPDLDYYSVIVPPPQEGEAFAPGNRQVGIRNEGAVPLKVTPMYLREGRMTPEGAQLLPPQTEGWIKLAPTEPGYVIVKVEAGAPIAPGASTAYKIACTGN